MLVYLVVLFTIVLLLFLLSMIWPPDSPWSPWWRTNGKVAKALVKLAKITKDDVIYDLGCGDGTVLITAAALKGTRGVGIEIDPIRVAIAKARVQLHRLQNRVTITRKDLFNEDISEASVIVVYLIPKALNRLEAKFRKELKPGTKIISYVYPIDYLPEIARDQNNNLILYKIPSKSSSGKN